MLTDRADVRTFEVKVRLSVVEMRKLRALADQRGLALAAAIRALALAQAQHQAMQSQVATHRAA
jgi:hypothetical protein